MIGPGYAKRLQRFVFFFSDLMHDNISVQAFFTFQHSPIRQTGTPDFGCPNIKSIDPKIRREQYVAYYQKTTDEVFISVSVV